MYKGKGLVCVEGKRYWYDTHYGNYAHPSKEEAESALDSIRKCHGTWEELDHGVEQDPTTRLWRAWRYHRKPIDL